MTIDRRIRSVTWLLAHPRATYRLWRAGWLRTVKTTEVRQLPPGYRRDDAQGLLNEYPRTP